MTFLLCLLFLQRENSLQLITPRTRQIGTEQCSNCEKVYPTKHKALHFSQHEQQGDRSCCTPGSLRLSGAPGCPRGVRVNLIMSSSGQEPGKAGVRNTAMNLSPCGTGLGASWKWCEWALNINRLRVTRTSPRRRWPWQLLLPGDPGARQEAPGFL